MNRSVIAIVGDTSECRIWLNSTKATLVSPLASGSSTGGDIFGSSGSEVPFEGRCRDVLLYSRALTDYEMQNTIQTFAISRGCNYHHVNQVICCGDSITHGYLATMSRSTPWRLGQALTYRLRNTGLASVTLQTLAGEVARETAMFVGGETNIVVLFAGTNDILAGRTDTQVTADMHTYAAAVRAASGKIIVVTMLLRSTFNGTQQTYRTNVNNEMLADVGVGTYYDGVVDLTGATINLVDSVHPDNAGMDTIATAEQPIIAGLL